MFARPPTAACLVRCRPPSRLAEVKKGSVDIAVEMINSKNHNRLARESGSAGSDHNYPLSEQQDFPRTSKESRGEETTSIFHEY